jgi:hypothetical protein
MNKDLKKLNTIINDLTQMSNELNESETKSKPKSSNSNEQKIIDKEAELNKLINRVKKDSDLVMEQRKKQKSDNDSFDIIKLKSNLRNDIKLIGSGLKELQNLLEKEEHKNWTKKKISDSELAYHKDVMKIMNDSLELISELGNLYGSKNELAREIRKKEKDVEIQKRRTSHKKKSNIDEHIEHVENPFEQELVFMKKVEDNYKDQDIILKQIEDGLDDLLNLARDINKELGVQKIMLDDVDNIMEENIVKLKTANKKLKDILDKSGGTSRWVPIIMLTIISLAIVGVLL